MANPTPPKSFYALLADVCRIVRRHEQILRGLQADVQGLKDVLTKDAQAVFLEKREAATHDLGNRVESENQFRLLDEAIEKLRGS